ncbi:SAF domain-containing protein [Caldicoprobacter algeriensis]|uniref:SAF domain-containing protein n=1 Tax=Caldicoprobacter algeriensis TaxID=699281 RepID=UPI002079C348|nr:SAF domain-containing protein [Caldicoprobacter algeriensis]MCM8901743.1 SAF domain-containing protein [Caldicoprobacter algeriensis]
MPLFFKRSGKKSMNRIIKIATAAAILIFVAAYLFFYNKEGTTNVVVVQQQISETTEVAPSMITVKPMPVSAVPRDVVKSPDEVVGKMLLVGRMPGDLIPRSIVVSPEDVELKEDEILLSIPIPAMDSSVAQFNKKIILALLPSSQANVTPILIDNIEIHQIKSIASTTGGQQQYAIIKTTLDNARLMIPYIASGAYKILNNKGQPLSAERTGQQPANTASSTDVNNVNNVNNTEQGNSNVNEKVLP